MKTKTKMMAESQHTILGCSVFVSGEWDDVARIEKALIEFELSELKKKEDARKAK